LQKYYIYFVDNLLLFPTVKELSKSVTIWWSYRKNSTAHFFETQCSFNVFKHIHYMMSWPRTLTFWI